MTVRSESVRLSLDDAGFSTGMVKAAAATALLDRNLDSLDGTSVNTGRSIQRTSTDTDRLSTSAVRGSASIDKFSGRMGILLKLAAALGPALTPIGAVGIAGVSGLANQFGFAAVAAGTAVLAFQGVGEALEAVNKAALDPTTKNLEEAVKALEQISPPARAVIAQLQEMKPLFEGLRDTAAAGLFPGFVDGLQSIERLAPALDSVLSRVSETLGDIFAGGAESLASPRWADFFAMLATDARPVLTDMASAIGSVAHGLSEMWEAFQPLNRDFGSWLADAARGFDKWATGLSQTEGFENFVTYIRDNGPKVAEAMGAIGNAFVQIVQAGAPLGGPVLEALANIANAIATIADSPLGTPIMAGVTALSAMSLAANVATASVTRLNAALAATSVAGGKAGAGKGLAVAGGPAGIAGLVGLLNVDNFISNIDMMLEGERNFVEGLGRMAAAANPVGAVMQALGVDILGTEKPFLESAVAAGKLEAGLHDLDGAGATTRREIRRFGDTFFDAQKQILRATQRSEELKKAIQGEREAAREAAASWLDYSQKVQLGTTSIEDLIRRWEKLGEAAANMGDNIRTALKKGIDPKVIQSIVDVLGPQGAAQAIDELAKATPAKAKQIAAAFGVMSGGAGNFQRALRLVKESISGNQAALDRLGRTKAKPEADLEDAPLRGGVASAERLLTGLHRERPEPNADLDYGDLRNGVASAEQLLTGLNGRTANTYVVTHLRTVRDAGDTAGGAPALRADGGTVPGQRYPYADKTLILAAPGEEVISNRHGQADRYRADRAAGRIPAYADGGRVGGMPMVLTRGGDNETERESRRTGEALRGLQKRLKETTAALEKEKAERDKVIDKMKSLGSSVSGGLQTSLFDQQDPWTSQYGAGTLAGATGILGGDLRQIAQMRRAIRELRSKGLTGPALAYVLSEGGLAGAQAFADESRAELREFSAMFNRRSRDARRVGQMAGTASFGAQRREANQEIRELKQEVRHIKNLLARGNKDRKDEHQQDRNANRRGAGNGQRNRRRDR